MGKIRIWALAAFSGLILSGAATEASAAVEGRPDRSHISFAYLQSPTSTDIRGARWGALTHIGWSFITFTTGTQSGNTIVNLGGVSSFNSRSSELKPGGVASNHGVKVVVVLANAGFSETLLAEVMTSATLRDDLRSKIVAVVADPTNGCDGINLDFEFTWGSSTRDGMMVFIQDLYNDLKALSPPRELSIYTIPTWSSTQYNASVLTNFTDYVIYSGYDFASGNTMTAKGRYGTAASFSIVGNIDGYLSAGIPADHLVLALPFYTGNWTTTVSGSYGQVGSSPFASGLVNANYDTTYRSTPHAKNYSSPVNHWTRWYSRLSSGIDYTLTTFDDAETLEHKFRLAKNWKGDESQGLPLRGVAFWSLLWVTGTTSVDPNNTGAGGQSLTRTINYPYYLMEELFAPPGTRVFRAETFEHISSELSTGYNARWRDPNDGPDDQNCDAVSTRAPAAAPSGAPAGSNEVMALTFRFTNTPNRLLFKHQPLYATTTPYTVDWGNAIVPTDNTTKFIADVHVPAAYNGTTIRMVVRDGNNQLERGPTFSLATSGWRQVTFDLANDAVTAYATAEGGVSSGNGVIDTAGNGARDIAFIGFEVSSSGFLNQTGTINIDRILYTDAQPANARYTVNEFRYNDTTQQFVEIYGPAGAIPTGMQLISVDGANGNPVTTTTLSGSIPNDTGSGFGYFVVGTASVPNVDQVVASGFLGTGTPEGIQLVLPSSGSIHDQVVYKGLGGVGLLSAPQQPVVTDHGPGYIGEIGPGGTPSGGKYTAGRYPDGANSWINQQDFSAMPPTPGVSNGNTVSTSTLTTFDFATAPPNAFRTYNSASSGNFTVESPVTAGLPASPNGGNAHRVVDSSGGGSMSFIGDAALGHGSTRIEITGEVYVQANGAPIQACGLGVCVKQGSTFFTADAFLTNSGYEDGYWLIYENAAGAGLNDGQADHPGVWNFIHVTNDGADSTKSTLLASATNATLGVTPGQWTTFRFIVDPPAVSAKLVAQVNSTNVYSGAIPAGGPVNGAFAAGFRENHAGGPAAAEGTWIDNIQFVGSPPAGIEGWELY